MKQSNIFWGSVLIGIGSLLLLDRVGVLNFNWWQLLRLWPFLVILGGVVVLPIKNGLKVMLALLTLAASVWVYSVRTEHFDFSRKHYNSWSFDQDEEDTLTGIGQSFSEPFPEGIEKARLKMDAAAGNFALQGSTGELLYADSRGFESDFIFKVETADNQSKITIKQQSGVKMPFNNHNTFNMMLNTTPVWDFDFDIGGANFDFDLSNHKVEKLKIDGGAAAIDLKFGVLLSETSVIINTGASAVNISIPTNAGCRVEGSTVLSSRDIEGFNRIDNGRYETPDFEKAQQKINIKVDAAVSSFKIVRQD